VFMPEGHDKTFAEMAPEEKNKISHRRRSLEKLREFLIKKRHR
jgi:XTP/dITP diphosphohydrolase